MNFRILALGALIFCSSAHADRIGNGGGLWACHDANGDIRTAQLVDFFEARQEFQLVVPASFGRTPLEIYNAQKQHVNIIWPAYAKQLAPYFTRVEKNMVFVDAALMIVDDGLWRIRPLPQDCAGGQWDYLQFANFTSYDRVLIRNDFWNHPNIAPIDKAGLLFHEAIYLMMREQNGDADSVRSREITGLLFSNLPAAEIQARVRQLMNPQIPPPAPPKPIASQWTCYVSNTYSLFIYLGTGVDKIEAEFDSLKKCQAAGRADSCDESQMKCAPIESSSPSVSCIAKNSYSSISFLGKGRNLYEAQAKALIACQSEGRADQCAVDTCSE